MKDSNFKAFFSKLLKKPVYSFKELPEAIQSEVTKTLLIGGFCFILGLFFAIKSLTFAYFLYALLGIIIYFFLFLFMWYRYFIYDKVICYEGTIIEDGTRTSSTVNRGVKKFFNYTRKTYKLYLDNGITISVIKNGKKSCKSNLKVRIYVLPDSIIEKQDKTYLINQVLFTEILGKTGGNL